MTSPTTSTEYVILPVSEVEFAKKSSYLSSDEVDAIIEHRDTIRKFVEMNIRMLKIDLGELKCVGKEAEAYATINALVNFNKGIDKTVETYKNHIQKLDDEKNK